MRKKTCWALLGAAILAPIFFSSASTSSSESQRRLVAAPLNPEFLRYAEDRRVGKTQPQFTEEGYPLGLLPGPKDFSHLKPGPEIQGLTLPPTYDLRNKNKLTPIKDQGSLGSCWTFSAYGALESFFKPGQTWDFSEMNMVNNHGFDWGPDEGGHIWMSAAYLARWAGPVKESDDPYIYSLAGYPIQKHVQKIIFYPQRTGSLDNATIKNAIIKYGAVSAAMCWSSDCYNAATSSYHNPNKEVGGHAICIIGWNDTYPKSKFKPVPKGNGAFIARNSWGTDWGLQGYFYVSYYDRFFGRRNVNAILTAEPLANYKKCYQYDTLGWVNSIGYDSPTAWFANIFPASNNASLKAVGFYADGQSAKYEIYIHTNITPGKPRSGKMALKKAGTIPGAGYYTIPLGTLVPIKSGQKFSVVVKLTTVGFDYPIPVEFPLADYSSKAVGSSGQSFASKDGIKWEDLTKEFKPKTNACIKAFTAN